METHGRSIANLSGRLAMEEPETLLSVGAGTSLRYLQQISWLIDGTGRADILGGLRQRLQFLIPNTRPLRSPVANSLLTMKGLIREDG